MVIALLLKEEVWYHLKYLQHVTRVRSRIYFCTIFILVSLSNPSASTYGIRKFNAPDYSGAFQQVVVNPRNGDIFVAGRNVVYQLSEILKVKQVIQTGPLAEDETRCNTPNGCRTKNNNARILEVDPGNKSLLYCGSAVHGTCSVFSLENLDNVSEISYESHGDQVDASASMVAAFAQDVSPLNDSVLFIAHSYNQHSTSNVPAQIIRTGWKLSSSIFSSKTTRKVGFDETHGDSAHQRSFDVRYLNSFQHENFVYFVTVQQESISEPFGYETRLIRVCKDDPGFHSYTEVTLLCRQKSGLRTFYNIAVAASLSQIGAEFARKFQLESKELALFVILGKSVENSVGIDGAHGYGLCIYPIRDVKNEFVTAQKDCYSGRGRLLAWIDRNEPKCKEVGDQAKKIDDSFCGSEVNVGIGGRYPLSTETNITFQEEEGHAPTTVQVTLYEDKTIAVIGTAGGHLLKFLIDGSNSEPYARLDIGDGHPVDKDVAFDRERKHIYVLSGSRVSMVPVESCSIYTDCASCITTRDPLGCGWCDDQCSTKSKCLVSVLSWSNTKCPPIIESFHPRSGPVRGGTRLTIRGQNFGNGTRLPDGASTVTVMVAGSNCAVEFRNFTSIVCQTGPSLMRKTLEKDVKVMVSDPTRSAVPFEILGPSSSGGLTFAYKSPIFTSFSPVVGPMSGGTLLTVCGTDLDTGSTQSVLVAYQPCNIERVSAVEIVCRTSAFDPNSHHLPDRLSVVDHVTRGPVNISIDSEMLGLPGKVFVYHEDPTVTDLFPHKSFLSGGMPITVKGSNLHIIQEPQIIVRSSKGLLFFENCESHSSGRTMICRSPDLTGGALSVSLSPDASLRVRLAFEMDGVKDVLNVSTNLSDFTYEIDPEVTKFTGVDRVRVFHLDENYLEIQGQFLDLAATSVDYRISIGDSRCDVTQLTSTLLLCRPDKSDILFGMDSIKEVKVFVGRLVFHVGFLQFAERHKESFLMLTAAPIMGSLALVIVILLFYLLHRLWRKKCALDFSATYPHHALNRFEMSVMPTDVRFDELQNSYLFQDGRNRHLNSGSLTTEESLGVNDWLFISDLDILIAKERIILQDIIGQGHFGCVYRGILKSADEKSEVEVAVKTLKSTQDNLATNYLEARKFYEEALRMRDFDHAHILRLIGIAQDDDGMPLVVLPFMRHGDLLTYIRCERNSPTVRELMEFGIQVAEGMAYLSSLKYVHRDLAARNCMLDEEMQIKVADFGLSRDVYERDYYSCDNRQTKLPVKWMALESLEKGIYNSKTDVWSYGIVLWELLTRGISPYPEVDNWDVVRFLKSGRRMSQPAYAPDDLYSLMLICWHPVPSVRPSFDELIIEIRGIIRSLEPTHRPVQLNSSYVNAPLDQPYLDQPYLDPLTGPQLALEADSSRFASFRDTSV